MPLKVHFQKYRSITITRHVQGGGGGGGEGRGCRTTIQRKSIQRSEYSVLWKTIVLSIA